MTWITPITDRSYADIANRTSKAFMNTSDFTRIDGNTDVIRALLDDLYGLVPAHTDPTAPTIETIPHRSLINTLVGNINACSAAAIVSSSKRPAALSTYSAGAGVGWAAVNAWEQALATLYAAVPLAAAYRVYCGVPAAGQPRLWQARFRQRYSIIDTSAATLQASAESMGYEGSHAFDGDKSYFWTTGRSFLSSGGTEWVQAVFTTAPTVCGYRFWVDRNLCGAAGEAAPRDFVLEHSNDGLVYTPVDTQEDVEYDLSNYRFHARTYIFDRAGIPNRHYWRFRITGVLDSSYAAGLNELELFTP